MFDEAFTKLEIEEIALILDVINKKVEGSIFDPLETTIMAIDIPFYSNHRFLDIADYATNPPLQRFAIQKTGTMDFVLLDWSYKIIQQLNTSVPISLTEENVLEYVRFYFSHVKGRHGRFIVCETVDHIKWKDEPPEEIRKSINQAINPLEIIEKRKDDVYQVKAFMMLKDALFQSDVYIEPNGNVTITNHEVLIENVPVLDSVVGQ
tara:strand:- start:891 stop:1511 length:621 start_codon:yes stop_codon:yes gene_type:complete